MATALDIVNTAQQQVGFVEGTNNDNPYGTWYEMGVVRNRSISNNSYNSLINSDW